MKHGVIPCLIPYDFTTYLFVKPLSNVTRGSDNPVVYLLEQIGLVGHFLRLVELQGLSTDY